MSSKVTRVSLGNGINLTGIQDKKFRQNRLSINFILPLSEETAAENAIVPLLLRKGSKTFPDFSALNSKLNQLYGANLGANISKFNGYQVLKLYITALDNRYALEDENIAAECTKLLVDMVLEPNFDENGFFPEKYIELEKQYLIDSIEAEINDKRQYSSNQCLRYMCKNEPLAIRSYGEIKTVDAITPQSATNAWKRIVETAVIEVSFAGCGDSSNAEAVIRDSFAKINRQPIDFKLIKLSGKAKNVQEIDETMELSQANLILGMRVDNLENRKSKNAAVMFSTIYGGSATSKLFVNVREAMSLCYYCYSSMDTTNNIMFVGSGIESANKEKAKNEILRQLELMQNGEITEKEIVENKLVLTSQLASVGDSMSTLEGWYLTSTLKGDIVSPEEHSENLNKITKEDIVAIANSISLDTIYFLSGETKEG